MNRFYPFPFTCGDDIALREIFEGKHLKVNIRIKF
jgi:hypothetical protein